jgi:hypothetical protein
MCESLNLRWELASTWGLTSSFATLATLAVAQGEFSPAACLWGVAEVLRENIGASVLGILLIRYERDVAKARLYLDGKSFEAAWLRGRTMGLEEAFAYARR